MDEVPLVAFEREWRSLVRGELAVACRRWSRTEAALTPFAGPEQMLAFLWDEGVADEAQDRVLAALLRLAQTERLAGRVLLQALLPGLKARASRLLRRRPERPSDPPALERGELWQVLFVSLLERIQTYPLEKRPRKIASNLLWDVEHVTLAELERARAGLNELPRDEPLEVRAPGEVPADVEALLQDAVTVAAISASEAELIAATYVEGVALGEVARRLGLTYNTVKVRRQNAVRGLLMFLNEQAEIPYLEVDPDSRRKRPTSVRMQKKRTPPATGPGRPAAGREARPVRAVPGPELSFEQGGHTSEGT